MNNDMLHLKPVHVRLSSDEFHGFHTVFSVRSEGWVPIEPIFGRRMMQFSPILTINGLVAHIKNRLHDHMSVLGMDDMAVRALRLPLHHHRLRDEDMLDLHIVADDPQGGCETYVWLCSADTCPLIAAREGTS
jgi:hypothetical protein